MNPFSIDFLKVLKLLKYKYDARFLLSDPDKAPDFPFFKIYLSEEGLKRAGVPLNVIDILHGSINRMLEIPTSERSEWYDTVWPIGEDEPLDIPDKENYLVFTVTPDLKRMMKDIEEKTQRKVTYYDISNSSLIVNGVAHKVSRESEKLNAHHILKYIFENGQCPFDEWLDSLKNKKAQAIIMTRLNRVTQGNFGLCRRLDGEIWELKIDFGPGYRIYFAEEGDVIVVLLCGGDKSTQTKDIEKARDYWAEYNRE